MKWNTVKKIRQRVLALMLALTLLVQTAPLATLAANAEETASIATEIVEPVEENLLEVADAESAMEEAVIKSENDEPAVESESAELKEEKAAVESEITEEEEAISESESTEQPEEAVTEEAATEETEKDPYEMVTVAAEGIVEITNADQLIDGVPAGSTYVLTDNIVMGADQQISVVAGVLDGAGHTITISEKSLVRELTGTIQNLIVDGKAALQGGEGSIVGTIRGGTLQNCAATVKINPGLFFTNYGGLAGTVENGKIYNSYFAGSGRDEFGLPAINGIFYISDNSQAPSTIKNCYYTDGNYLGSGSAWNKKDPSNGKRTLDAMKTPEFVQLLNAADVGSGYIWAAVEGELPRLVPGGGELEPCDKTDLETAIKEARQKNEGDYTNDTWMQMQDALNAAIKVNEKIGATQDEVNEAAKKLQDAIAALEEKVRDLSPVEPPKNGVIEISNQKDLAKIDGSNPNSFYRLAQDIVIDGNFLSPNLAGVLDGNGHTITIRIASPIFNEITETGVVQNVRVKVEGNFTNRQEFAPFANNLKGGMIVNCISEVTGQHSAGYVRKMENGVMVNCLTMGHNLRGAFVYFQKSTDHKNVNGYKSGEFYNCYWSVSNSVENITPEGNLIDCEPVGDEKLRSEAFIAQLNNQKGEFGALWGRGSNGYPYFGEDQGGVVIDGSKNRYPVQFVWHDNQILDVKNGNLKLSPQMTGSNRFAGTFQLKDVPKDSTITWSCDDRADQQIMQLGENGELYVFHDGGGVVRAVEHKADGTKELAAELRVVSASREIEELRLVLDGQMIQDAVTVQGSAVNTLKIQAKYVGSEEFQTMPAYLVELKSEKPELLRTDYNTAQFYFKEPGTSKLTVVEKTNKQDPASITVTVTSAYVPVKSVKPAINGIEKIHYRNSMGSGQFISIQQTVFVEPSNASYKNNVIVESSDPTIAQFDGSGYIPYRNGDVTFTAKINDNGKNVEGKSTVSFVYTNPLTEVTASKEKITLDQGAKQTLPLIFHGQAGNPHEITEPNLVWTFDKKGIVSIQRPNELVQIWNTGGPDNGNWVASSEFEVKGLKPGTVVATGTPVDSTGGAKPVEITITVNGDGSEIKGFDIPEFIKNGKTTASNYLKDNNTFKFGEEWSIYALLRDGQTLPQQRLDDYYNDVVANAHFWNPNILATEVERTAIALNVMGKDITNVGGVNFVELICDHPNLTKQGSNSLAWALIALDMNNTEIPADMNWSRERMVTELLTYQNKDGGFGLDKNGLSEIDMTAMSLQALARYQDQSDVAKAIDKGIAYLSKAAERNLNLGNSESISQVIIALAVLNRDIVEEPGFGDEMDNIMSALSEYMVEGKGFKHSKKGEVAKMATAQAMQALCAYERFLNGESGYWDLKGTGTIEDPAKTVSNMIAALPDKISVADAEKVRAARTAYDTLTDVQKSRVKNVDKLVKAEKMLEEALAVQQVVDAINNLPEKITLANAHAVKATREAYEQLTVKQKEQVTNLKKLEDAEAALKKLANPDSVIEMIDALPKNITLENKDAVQAARAAYELLTKEQQKKVTNLEKLENAEKKLDELASAQQVQQVIDAINALPKTITVKDEAAVQAVRAAYNQLSEAQKAQVTNADKLIKAEKAIADQKAAEKVEKAIKLLPESVGMADKKAVQAARSAYEALSADQKALVKNLNKLIKAEEDLEDLDAAQKVMSMIKDLPVDVALEDEQAIEDARSAYQALTEKQKKLVLNLYLLERAEQTIEEKKAVQAVEDAINALPETITKEDSEAIKAARAAYNQLSPELRKQVENLDKLIRAEKALRALRKSFGKPSGASESNVVEAVAENGVVSAKQLEDIKGKDLILKIKGTMESGESYVLSIYGKDIVKAEDLKVEMNRKGLYEEDIHKLSEDPEIFRFLETGTFPAPIMVEMDTDLADGEYLLLHYDPIERRASLVSRVQVQDGKVQFIVQEGGEYFLTKKASKKSVLELEEEKKVSSELQPESQSAEEEATSTVETAKPVQQKADKGSVAWIWLPLLLLPIAGVVVVLSKRKENKSE